MGVSISHKRDGCLLSCHRVVISQQNEDTAARARNRLHQPRKAHSASYGHGQDLQSYNLRGKVSVVTGANSGQEWMLCFIAVAQVKRTLQVACKRRHSHAEGIGREIAEFLVARGSRVYMAPCLCLPTSSQSEVRVPLESSSKSKWPCGSPGLQKRRARSAGQR